MNASSILCLALVAFGLSPIGSVSARTLSFTADRLQDGQVTARGIRLHVDERADAPQLRLEFDALVVPLLGLDAPFAWHCPLQRLDDGARACKGQVRVGTASDAVIADLGVRWSAQMLEMTVGRDAASVILRLPFGDGLAQQVVLEQVPVEWLKPPLRQALKSGELRHGVFDADARRHPDGRIEADLKGSEVEFSSNDGTVGVQGLAFGGRIEWTPLPAARLVASAALRGGVMQLGDLLVALPDSKVDTRVDVSMHDGLWEFANFAWRDADVLSFEGSGVLEPAALAPLRTLQLTLDQVRFPLAMRRYGEKALAAAGLSDLAIQGDLAGTLRVDDGITQRMAFATTGLDVASARTGIAIRRMTGGIEWSRSGQAAPTTLAWKAARFEDIALPAMKARWQSRDGALHLLGGLELALLGGRLKLEDTVLQLRPDAAERLATRFTFARIGYDNAEGTIAATGLAGSGHLEVSGNVAAPRLKVAGQLEGGELLAGPVYLRLPAVPVELQLDATLAGSHLQVHRFNWSDPGVLGVSGDAEIALDQAKPLRSLHLEVAEANLPSVVARYARSWLNAKGYPDLTAEGQLAGTLAFDEGGLQQFAFEASAVALRDPQRFSLAGVTGAVAWRHGEDTTPTTLAWTSAELYRVPLGGGRAQLESRGGAIVLAQALPIDVLGGQVRLEKLSLQPRSPRGDRYAGSFAIVGIEMAQLSAALGWPRFGGNLSGGIPEIEFSGDTIELRGGLDLYVFDGHLGLSGLSLERPFGIAPSLGVDVHFENLDLDQITSAFSFGGMSGRLDGTVGGLRLVDWSAVAFDAWVRTKAGGRMSYKAVNDLTAIGGGGLSDNLQTMALKIFDTFGFRHLGIRCRLVDGVCRMAGIDAAPLDPAADSADDSYTIVEGSGVPRIHIVGHRRRVDWATLVRRLEEATQGQAPIIK